MRCILDRMDCDQFRIVAPIVLLAAAQFFITLNKHFENDGPTPTYPPEPTRSDE